MDLAEDIEAQVKRLNEEMLQEIVERTKKVHASFLFWGPVTNLLKQLSMHLCATPVSRRYNGWVELGVQLGLEPNAVKSIENTQIMAQDPVYVMFLAYSQENNATIADIYFALSQLKRNDVICETHSIVVDFHEKILLQFTIPSEGILRPPRTPEVPHIFQNFSKSLPDKDIAKTSKVKTKLFKKIVLLTYVPARNHKGQESGIVERVVAEFRKKINGKSIGVLMLEEHREEVFRNSSIIQAFYKSANYIIPILTTEYLTQITGIRNSVADNLDEKFATYVYSTMMLDYLNSGCKNKKVRCIIADDDLENVRKHYFFQPLFQAWTKESDISKMAKRILNGKI